MSNRKQDIVRIAFISLGIGAYFGVFHTMIANYFQMIGQPFLPTTEAAAIFVYLLAIYFFSAALTRKLK